jgi:hypothetical protein
MIDYFHLRSDKVFSYGPFAIDGEVHSEKEAFDYSGHIFVRIADTEELYCPATITEVGDAVEILLSLSWSDKVAKALDGIRWPATLKTRSVEVRNSEDRVLGSFTWIADFGRYDVLDRERSSYTVIKDTNAIMRVDRAVLDGRMIPPCDIWGSMYGAGFFVTSDVKSRIEQSGCVGFSFSQVEIA